LLETKIYPNPKVQQFLSTSYVGVLLKSESEEGQHLMSRYDMPGIPALLVMDANGRVIGKTEKPPLDPASFIKVVTRLSKGRHS